MLRTTAIIALLSATTAIASPDIYPNINRTDFVCEAHAGYFADRLDIRCGSQLLGHVTVAPRAEFTRVPYWRGAAYRITPPARSSITRSEAISLEVYPQEMTPTSTPRRRLSCEWAQRDTFARCR